jgi:2,3-bisphosphoglycerate-dependent phosphoglycerate mutase
MAGKLILCRHGESEWNLENRFTGWADVGLSPKGEQEAKDAGLTLKHEQLSFDLAYTSVLKRATRTLWIMLEEMSLTWIPVINAWELNERHYGALQGLNKSQVAAEYGEEQVQIWRRSYDTPPPALNNADERHPRFEIRYASVSDLPASESLKDTLLRVKPYWQTKIIPSLLGNQDVLIVAHGNSLRAMVKMIENISDKEIMDFNIPTGIPLAYEFNENLKPIKQGFIGDPETIKQAAQAVANQGLV